jgi:uncharacterized membrane protein YczE
MANLGNLPLSYRPIRRLTALFVGLGLYGAGMSMMIAARLGLDPWDVFHQGMSKLTGIRFGWIVIAVGAAVLLLWIPLRQRPSLGTIANVVVIGLSVNWVSDILPVPHALAVRWAYAIGGIVTVGIASGLYIGTRLGPGPRDGLMTGVVMQHPRTSIRLVRTCIEATVLLIGFLLGGQVGWVTLIFAITIGPIAHVMIPLLTIADPAQPVAPAPEPARGPAQESAQQPPASVLVAGRPD